LHTIEHMFEAEGAEDGVRTALEAYPDDPAWLNDQEAGDGFAQLQRISEAVEAKRLRWLADQDRRATYRRDGYLSAAAWLADRFKVAAGSAKQQVKVAQALEKMPDARHALEAGEVSSSALRVLVAAREAHPEAFSVQEPALIEQAQTKSVEELRRVMADWSQAVDEEGSARYAQALRGRRRLDACPMATGMVRVDGELDPEGGEALLTALQAIGDADLRSGNGMDLRTPAQRRADALCELAHRFLRSPERPTVAGERPHVTLTVDINTLRGAEGFEGNGRGRSSRCELDHTGTVHPATARRLACDSTVLPVVMGGQSEPLDVGRRTPVVSAALRRAIVLRDSRCRFPACVRPHAWCDAHHVKHWADGGETSLHNLVLLCRPHHRLVHEGGFALRMERGRPVFRRPDGSVLAEERAPP
jgi:uncharacterized protein DUF222/HNH endonuclease